MRLCLFTERTEDGFRCEYCRRIAETPAARHCDVPEPDPGVGPGSELRAILKELGIQEKPKCGCTERAAAMDLLGVEGCRRRFDDIVGWMREAQDKYSWGDRLKAAGNAAASGLAFKVNWLDPLPGLVEEAIRRAEEAD